MYQVITMFGDNEPWWFFEDWEEDIEEEETFESFEEARQAYEKQWNEIHQNYEYINAKVTFSAPFGMTEMSAGVKSVTMIYSNTRDLRC